jgi:hypothetical protein
MGKLRMATALPGFPGASHIYRVGATGFFLDHPEHIKLTTRQQADLNRVKEKALLDKSSGQRKIDEAEQELWALTASDQQVARRPAAGVHPRRRRGGQGADRRAAGGRPRRGAGQSRPARPSCRALSGRWRGRERGDGPGTGRQTP